MIRALLALLVASCGGFRPIGGTDGALTDDGATTSQDLTTSPGADLVGGGSGPGPRGALPTGHCCQSDDECRHRACITVSNVRMCADRCYGDSTCAGIVTKFHCTGDQFNVGRCEPDQPVACIPAAKFTWGGKKAGACCDATGDGRAGTECEGGLCISIGDISNPFVCTHNCSGGGCPGGWQCAAAPDGRSECMPLAMKYTCQ